MKTIGNNIKKIRELNNFNQQHMAQRLGISQSEYSRIENGVVKSDGERLQKISVILKVKIEILYNFDENDLLHKK
ncbi:MAG: helix-turn-helix transcriptional regulator [Bacteroidota bacterium]